MQCGDARCEDRYLAQLSTDLCLAWTLLLHPELFLLRAILPSSQGNSQGRSKGSAETVGPGGLLLTGAFGEPARLALPRFSSCHQKFLLHLSSDQGESLLFEMVHTSLGSISKWHF